MLDRIGFLIYFVGFCSLIAYAINAPLWYMMRKKVEWDRFDYLTVIVTLFIHMFLFSFTDSIMGHRSFSNLGVEGPLLIILLWLSPLVRLLFVKFKIKFSSKMLFIAYIAIAILVANFVPTIPGDI